MSAADPTTRTCPTARATAVYSLSRVVRFEVRLLVHYANGTGGFSAMQFAINGTTTARVPFPRTAAWGAFSRTTVAVPVDLAAGVNTVRLTKPADGSFTEIDRIELSAYPRSFTAAILPVAVANAGFDASGASPGPTGWNTWPGTDGTSADADFTEAHGFSGGFRLTHYKASPYEVFTSQTLTGLTDGTYTLTGWAMSSGGQEAGFLSAKNYGSGAPELTAGLPVGGFPDWQRVSISGIPVTNGQLEISLYSKASGGQWSSLDGVQVWRQ